MFAKNASLTVTLDPVVKSKFSIPEILAVLAFVKVTAASNSNSSLPAPPSTVSVPNVV